MAKPLYRFFEFDRSKVNSDDRTIPVCFSSETAVDRGEYDEILDHGQDGVDLVRLKDSHPLLLNHDPDKQIGVIESAVVDTDKRGRALVRFGNSPLAQEIFNDVKDGIRKHLSVGYERIKALGTTTAESGRRAIRFAWRPFELSIVPVPADPTVGVGRSKETGKDGQRTFSNEMLGYVCRDALRACNGALGEIDECEIEDESHAKAAEMCRDNIAALAITCEDTCYWSEATCAECVATCAECAGVCNQTIAALRAIASCAHCGTCANSAIQQVQEAAEACRSNAGIEEPSTGTAQNSSDQVKAVAEGENGGTVIDADTRANVDTRTLANAETAITPANAPNDMRILLDAAPATTAPAAGGAAGAPTVTVESVRNSAVEAERTRVKNIRASIDAIAPNWPEENVREFRAMADQAVAEGASAENFNADLFKKLPGARKASVITCESLGMSDRDINEYSLMRGIQSVLKKYENGGGTVPDGHEGDVHRAMAQRIKESGAAVTPAGFWVPPNIGQRGRARRDLNVTTASQGGNFVATQLVTTPIELLRNRMVTQRLGVQSMAGLEGNIAIPRQTGAATVYSLAESATLTKSTQAIDQITLTPHRVGAYNEYTKQLLLQSSVDVENFMRDDLMKQVAIKWDKLILEGSGSASEPAGVLHTSGIGSVTFSTTATYAKMVAFVTALRTANADLGNMAYVTTPTVRGALETTAKLGSTFPIFIWENGEFGDGSDDGKVGQYRAVSTNQIASDKVAFGNWQDAIHALWGGFDVLVNPYARDIDAAVRITVNTFGDVAVRHAASFAWSTDSGAL